MAAWKVSRQIFRYFRSVTELDYENLLDVAKRAVGGLTRSAVGNVRDDVAQDALEELLTKNLLDGHPNPEALVTQAVKWKAIDTQRWWNRAKQRGVADAQDDEPHRGRFPPTKWATPSPSVQIVNREALREAFESLDPGDKLILWLHDVEGWSFETVAEEVELAVGTTRNRASAARTRLRQLLSS
jgi:RNA polymerase sigma factor (sigma-70 family)